MTLLTSLILAASLMQPIVIQVADTDIDNQQKVPLIISGLTRNDRPADLFGPTTFTVTPLSAGVVDAQDFFIPADDFEGQAVVVAEALNRKNEVVTGQIVFAVSNAPAVAISVTAGTPVDK